MKERIKKAVELRNQGKLEESNEVMKDLVKEYPENAEVNYQCAWSFDVLSLEKEAIPYYEKAIAGNLNDEDMQEAYIGIGSTYRVIGRYQDSKDIFEKGMKLFPENRAMQIFYAMTLHNLGLYNKAIEIVLRNLAETSNETEIKKFSKAIRFYSDKLDKIW